MFYDQKIRKEVKWMIIVTAISYIFLYYIVGKETAILITMFVLVIMISQDVIYIRNAVKNLQDSESDQLKEHIDQRLDRTIEVLNEKIDSLK